MLKSKAARLPDSWNGINYYGYKNSICIDDDHSFIRLYAVTPANVHDSQMLPHLLDP
jgi:transposase, IS5 family